MSDWIDLNLPYWLPDGDCFEGLGLNKPGTLIDTKCGTFLVGDINPLRGGCDHCPVFSERTIVKRYKVVWEEKIEIENDRTQTVIGREEK